MLSLRADDVRNLPAPQRRCGFGLTATLIGRGVPVFVAAAALLELLPRTKPRAACLMGAGMLVMLRVEQRPGAAEELARTGDLPASEPDEEQFLACDGRNIPKGVDVDHLMDVQFAAEGDSDPVLRDGRTRREPNRNSRAFGGNEGLRP